MASRREQQKLTDAIKAHRKGQISSFTLNRKIEDYQRAAQQAQLSEYQRSGKGKRGIGASASRAIAKATKGLGRLGSVLEGLFTGRDQGYTGAQLSAVAELIKEYQSQHDVEDLPDLARSAARALESQGWSLKDAEESLEAEVGSRARSIESEPGAESDYQSGHRLARSAGTSETPRMSKKVLTPQSSNVYSFQYDYLTSTLYVNFQAPGINKKSVTNYMSSGGLPAIAGELGKTVGGKTGGSGYTYAYFDVPIKVYKKIIADQSPGGDANVDISGGVWGRLRERGSIYGTQYRYTLVSGAVVTGENDEPAIYVPRRATSKGFQSRSVAQPGEGRRQYVSSTLPPDMRGHGRTRGRPTQSSRGRPDPPNRGRSRWRE